MSPEREQEIGLQIMSRRWFPVTPDYAFRAFTQPMFLRQWWKPEAYAVLRLEFPTREGEDYLVRLRSPAGTSFAHTGTVIAWERPSLIAYTWRWIDGPFFGAETLVEIAFTPERDGVMVDVRHSRFMSQEDCDRHAAWFDVMAALAAWLLTPLRPGE
jgi:uncharacterized protein YndB with AHSA1/START domain